MPTYVALLRWTDQGIRNVTETTDRAEQAGQLAERMGGRLVTLVWTQGAYDLVAIVEMPDDETMAAFVLASGVRGGVRSETLRAFSAEEMQGILQKLPQG